MRRTRPATSGSRLRVAIVCDQLETGGQELGMLELVRRLDRTRFVPHVYAFRNGPLKRSFERIGVPVLTAHRRAATDSWTTADAAARIRFRRHLPELFRRDRIDLCLVYAWSDAIAAAREAGVRAIVEHVDGPKLAGWIRDKSSCTLLICESRAIAALIEAQATLYRCEEVPIVTIRNGIDLSRFDPATIDRGRSRRALGIADDEFVVGTTARLVAVKNLGHLLEASRLLTSRFGHDRVRFVIAGPDGGERLALARRAGELGVERRVLFTGERHDVPQLLGAFDAFALPSIQEGVSFAVIEAMAMGLPIIASQTDSIAETIGGAGYLVGPLDPYRTALAVHELIEHPALRASLGKAARRLSRRHDVADMVAEYEKALRAAFRRAARERAALTRRIAITPGHPEKGGGFGQRLFSAFAARGLDVHLIALEAEVSSRDASRWPPARRSIFENTVDGRAARKSVLQWIAPDVVITECSRVVKVAWSRLPGEEVILIAQTGHPCAIDAEAMRAADRVVAADEIGRRELVARFPRWASKISRAQRGDEEATILALLGKPRPEA